MIHVSKNLVSPKDEHRKVLKKVQMKVRKDETKKMHSNDEGHEDWQPEGSRIRDLLEDHSQNFEPIDANGALPSSLKWVTFESRDARRDCVSLHVH